MGRVRIVQLGVEARQVAADHHLDDRLGADLVARQRPGIAAVAQHGDAVGELVHLRHAVADVDQRDALRAQLAHQPEQVLGLARGQRGGGLVEHQDARLAVQRAGDLDHLLLGDGQAADGRARPERRAEALQDRRAAGFHGGAIDLPAGAAKLAAEIDVLGDRQVRRQRQLLVDDGDAGALGVLRTVDRQRLAADQDLAARIGAVRAREDLHQGGLAGAVLAHQGQDLAAPRLQPDVAQRAHAGEGLGDPPHLQRRRG